MCVFVNPGYETAERFSDMNNRAFRAKERFLWLQIALLETAVDRIYRILRLFYYVLLRLLLLRTRLPESKTIHLRHSKIGS